MSDSLRIAIQKSGRLSESSLSLFRECGIKFSNGSGKLKSVASNFPIEFLFLRDDDIPGYVEDQVADLGVVGENVLIEKNKQVDLTKRLGFSKCRLSVAVPRESAVSSVKELDGKTIATSYPFILKKYLDEQKVTCDIHEISGSVEIAPGIGLTSAICDIVSSGSTLLSNGLKEIEVIFRSEAVLIASPNLPKAKQELLDKLIFRMESVLKAKAYQYILLNAPNDSIDDIIAVLPGMKSPTVMPLATEGWSSIHSVIEEDDFWDSIEALKKMGAQGILVVPIEKMIL